MKKLLVSGRLVEAPHYSETRDCLDVRWASFLESAGLIPVLLPVHAMLDPYLELPGVAGLLLTGGNDLSCVDPSPLSRLRDERELDLLERTGRAGLPVLGVCRGLQLIAWRDGYPLRRIEDHVGTTHRLIISQDSRFLSDFEGAEVNSYHGFGLDGEGSLLRVAARAADGTVEAVESPTAPILGIMWHPERNEPPKSTDVSLFQSFFAAGPVGEGV